MRPPKFANMLACFCGCGVQVASMTGLVMIAICFAFKDTEWRPYF